MIIVIMMTNSSNNGNNEFPDPPAPPNIQQTFGASLTPEKVKDIFINLCKIKCIEKLRYLLSTPYILEFDWSRDDAVTSTFEKAREQHRSFSRHDKMVLWGCINLINLKLYLEFKWLYINFLSPDAHSHLLHLILIKYIGSQPDKTKKLYFVVGLIAMDYKITDFDNNVIAMIPDESLLHCLHKNGSLSPQIARLLFIRCTKNKNKTNSNWLYRNMYDAVKNKNQLELNL